MELPLLQFETEQEWKDFLLQYPSWKVVNKNKMTEEILYEYRLVNGTKNFGAGVSLYIWRGNYFLSRVVSVETGDPAFPECTSKSGRVIDYMRNENE